ncbi:hypothetical protein [Phenylobacterium sp.]|jgi:hypothetical protein|uniref:hypothetical protein n=1 Tax=Phenylobacterium sp. TaxID=1871053 RepID=UPI002F41A7C6
MGAAGDPGHIELRVSGLSPSAESRRRTLVRNFILAIACLAGSAFMAFSSAHGLY